MRALQLSSCRPGLRGRAGRLRVGNQVTARDVLFPTPVYKGLGPTQWVPEPFPGSTAAVVWRGVPDNPLPPSSEVKNEYSYNSTPPLCLHVILRVEH